MKKMILAVAFLATMSAQAQLKVGPSIGVFEYGRSFTDIYGVNVAYDISERSSLSLTSSYGNLKLRDTSLSSEVFINSFNAESNMFASEKSKFQGVLGVSYYHFTDKNTFSQKSIFSYDLGIKITYHIIENLDLGFTLINSFSAKSNAPVRQSGMNLVYKF